MRVVAGTLITDDLAAEAAVLLRAGAFAKRADGATRPVSPPMRAIIEQLTAAAVSATSRQSADKQTRSADIGAELLPAEISTAEAAKLLELSERTVERRITDGSLQARLVKRSYRITRESVVVLCNSQRR